MTNIRITIRLVNKLFTVARNSGSYSRQWNNAGPCSFIGKFIYHFLGHNSPGARVLLNFNQQMPSTCLLQSPSDTRANTSGFIFQAALSKVQFDPTDSIKGKKVKVVCGSYSTAALRHIVPLPE